ncbi:hypothetical protein NMG60_11035939 [Bertholletia excelsa]
MHGRAITSSASLLLILLSMVSGSLAYRPGNIVPKSKMGQYHSALIPVPKPTGYAGADPYKVEKFLIPWVFVINWKSPEVPMIDFHFRYSGSDLHGVTAKVVDMPHSHIQPSCRTWWNYVLMMIAYQPNCFVEQTSVHQIKARRMDEKQSDNFYKNEDINKRPDIRKQFWDPQHRPKNMLVRYTWEEQPKIDVTSWFYILFGSGLLMTFVLSIYVMQSSQDKIGWFVKETVAESSMSVGGVAKVE